ncbi:MAG: ribonuclease III family protein [Candidatus Baldrarchaeota archaeon]|nr:ribonuclease III family protein [Candidatus Baldrarchaeota archaeon]
MSNMNYIREIIRKTIFSTVSYRSLRDVAQDKGLAKLGDVLVNFIYSLAKSLILGRLDAWKVSDAVLSRALKDASLLKILPRRSDRHSRGDAVEALIAYAWIMGAFDIENAVMLFKEEIRQSDFNNKKLETIAAVKAFKKLLEEIKPKIEILLVMRKVKKEL